VTSDGEIIKKFRKKWEANEEGCLDRAMADFGNHKEEAIIVEEAAE
jgi:hypothetical protein